MVEPTDEADAERYLVVRGRRWRRQDPILDPEVASALLSHLGRGRSALSRKQTDAETALSRQRVNAAKHGLGERGEAWWELTPAQRKRRAEDALRLLARLDAPAPEAIAEAIVTLLEQRIASATICPSEVARKLYPHPGWRGLMDLVRDVAAGLVDDGVIVATRSGRPVDLMAPGGPVRLGRGPRWS